MRLRVYTALIVMAALAAASANGQSCQQGGTHICGPNCNIYYDIIWDPNFSQTTCGVWQFDQGTQRVLSGTYCGGWPAPFGRFNGPSNGWRSISQSTTAQSQGSNFSFRYEYEITDPLNDPLTSRNCRAQGIQQRCLAGLSASRNQHVQPGGDARLKEASRPARACRTPSVASMRPKLYFAPDTKPSRWHSILRRQVNARGTLHVTSAGADLLHHSVTFPS